MNIPPGSWTQLLCRFTSFTTEKHLTTAKELGMKEFKSFESMIKDTVEGMIAVGAVPDLRK